MGGPFLSFPAGWLDSVNVSKQASEDGKLGVVLFSTSIVIITFLTILWDFLLVPLIPFLVFFDVINGYGTGIHHVVRVSCQEGVYIYLPTQRGTCP